jgi:hypothetical protein
MRLFRQRRSHQSARQFRPRTGSPICAGNRFFMHSPCHCKHIGSELYHGLLLPCWRCPVCGHRIFR